MPAPESTSVQKKVEFFCYLLCPLFGRKKKQEKNGYRESGRTRPGQPYRDGSGLQDAQLLSATPSYPPSPPAQAPLWGGSYGLLGPHSSEKPHIPSGCLLRCPLSAPFHSAASTHLPLSHFTRPCPHLSPPLGPGGSRTGGDGAHEDKSNSRKPCPALIARDTCQRQSSSYMTLPSFVTLTAFECHLNLSLWLTGPQFPLEGH